jgi:aminoglycoside phosphotransferase (APT) family kinase protein
LLRCLVDDPTERVSGWRATLASDPRLDRLYAACEGRIDELLDACPERRDLVHGDLLNRNVLVADDASRITAVYSWKCAAQGDFLYDIAWCTFWGPWHPGIAALDLWNRTLASPSLDGELTDAALRHHCYELHIGARHLAWNAWTENDVELQLVADHTQRVLDRGPAGAP